MCLTKDEMKLYKEQGYIFVPALFSPAEVEIMKEQLPTVFAEAGPRRINEKQGNMVRSVYGSHRTNEVFKRLSEHPRLVDAAMQLLNSDVYIYQFKVNAKAAFGGDVWEWHQDFIFWQKEDAMQTPRVINAAVWLDDVTEFNGPMFLIPGSHADGVIDMSARHANGNGNGNGHGMPSWINDLTADLKYSLTKDVIENLVRTKGIVAPKGPAGSVLFFDANIVHASPSNLSPFDRAVAFVTYNSVENVPADVEQPRPDFLVDRQVIPIVPLGDDALFM
jgi:L-proline 4-hydroxylase